MARLNRPMLTGQKIGKWSIGESFVHPMNQYRMYECVCECGTKKNVKQSHLLAGKTKSCGCSWTKHGLTNSKEYRVWDSMVRRCHNKNHKAYKNYGARGITVCDKWRKFDGFIEDMGFKEDGLSIERIDNSVGYAKENCKWATMTEQARNRRTTKLDIEKVSEIKTMLKNGVSQSIIAQKFSVSRGNISHIAQRDTWR